MQEGALANLGTGCYSSSYMGRKTEIWIVSIFAIVVLGIIALAFVYGGSAPSSATPAFTPTNTSPIGASDHVRGNLNAKVSVIEYGDFQCPACGAYEPLVEKLEQQFATSTRWSFRNFPLTQLHPNAMIAAQAAEAAALQGKYWEMHDLLYQKQNEWADTPNGSVVKNYFDGYAQSLGLNVQKFDTDIQSTAVKQKIANDVAAGTAAQVDHTPTFFINDVQIPNPQNYTDFVKVLEAAVASSTAQ